MKLENRLKEVELKIKDLYDIPKTYDFDKFLMGLGLEPGEVRRLAGENRLNIFQSMSRMLRGE